MNSNKHIYHIITSLGIGGAQKTLKYFLNSEVNTVANSVIALKKNNFIYDFISAFEDIFKIPNDRSSIVCCWMYHSILLGLFLKLFKNKITVVMMIRNGLDSRRSLKKTTFLVLWISSKLSWLASKSIYCSQSSMRSHIEFGFNPKNSSYNYNGIKLNFAELKAKVNCGTITFSTIARNEPQKGYNILLEALSLVDEMEFNGKIDYLIYGENVCKLKIPDFKKISVQLFDPLNTEVTVSQILDRSWCHILPSMSEGFANVNLEALSMSNYLICSDTGDSFIFPKKWCSTFLIGDSDHLSKLIFNYIKYNKKAIDMNEVNLFFNNILPVTNFDDLVYRVIND